MAWVLVVDWDWDWDWDWVNIRFFGEGGYWFRPYGESLG
ncbi:hypothetical protein PMI32_02997, partial [Pseudomonas sp. GM60]